jgi:tetratricopeptide (TPR) repeat protein
MLLINLTSKKHMQNNLSSALALRESGKYKTAQKWLISFIENHPNDAEALSLLSQVYLLDKKNSEAEQVLSKATLINAELPSINRNHARLLLNQGKAAEALQTLQTGFQPSTNDPEDWFMLAVCLGANKKDAEALPLIEKVLHVIPNYAEAFANRAAIRLRANDISGSIKDAQACVSIKPHLTQIWALLSHLYHQTNNITAAIEALKKAHELEPSNINHIINLGEFLRQSAKFTEAIFYLEQATELAPADVFAWTNLGQSLHQDKQFEKAKIAYGKALAINPNSYETWSNLGTIAIYSQDWAAAVHSFKQAININPNMAELYDNLGTAQQKLNQLDDAEASYKQAIVLKPDYAEAHSNLGLTLQALGKLEEAESSFINAIALKPGYAEIHSNLGTILQTLGKSEQAEACYRQAIDLKPDYAKAHVYLGSLQDEKGNLEQAEASYRQAIVIQPDHAEAHYKLGRLFLQLKQFEEAVKYFEFSSFHKSKYYLLRCLYLVDKALFYNKLDYFVEHKEIDPMIGSLCCRSVLRYGIVKQNLFCNNPFDYLIKTDLNTHYDFENIFVNTTKIILNENSIPTRMQDALSNGYQTHGNVFELLPDLTEEIQKIIRLEIEKYKVTFKNSKEGFITSWPTDYKIYGWLISMKSGGELRPHMHQEGWISGSIYINVPPKSNTDSGNLVVCIEDKLTSENKEQGKSIDVVTGSLCLFPASLHHYTIPFESEEERIVLAFDVVPKYTLGSGETS